LDRVSIIVATTTTAATATITTTITAIIPTFIWDLLVQVGDPRTPL
jgi:hypothetical protein